MEQDKLFWYVVLAICIIVVATSILRFVVDLIKFVRQYPTLTERIIVASIDGTLEPGAGYTASEICERLCLRQTQYVHEVLNDLVYLGLLHSVQCGPDILFSGLSRHK